MKLDKKDPPRTFEVKGVRLSHSADILLEPDELVTFTTPSGAEYDVARKDWGFYATPSVNRRLTEFGLRAALAENTETGARYVLIVERGKESAFQRYLTDQSMQLKAWLDDSDGSAVTD